MLEDLPIECKIDEHEYGLNVWHFVSLEEGQGHAKEGLKRIIEHAMEKDLEYVVINIGNQGSKDSEEFLSSLGFEIIESERDHVTAEIEIPRDYEEHKFH